MPLKTAVPLEKAVASLSALLLGDVFPVLLHRAALSSRSIRIMILKEGKKKIKNPHTHTLKSNSSFLKADY